MHIFQLSIYIARILYGLPAWGGFISGEHEHKRNAFLNALNAMDCIVTIDDLISKSIHHHFKKMHIPFHCWYHIALA